MIRSHPCTPTHLVWLFLATWKKDKPNKTAALKFPSVPPALFSFSSVQNAAFTFLITHHVKASKQVCWNRVARCNVCCWSSFFSLCGRVHFQQERCPRFSSSPNILSPCFTRRVQKRKLFFRHFLSFNDSLLCYQHGCEILCTHLTFATLLWHPIRFNRGIVAGAEVTVSPSPYVEACEGTHYISTSYCISLLSAAFSELFNCLCWHS